MLTRERVEELMTYDPESGLFRWKKVEGRGHRELEGKIAGCLAPNGYIMLGIDKKLYRAHRVVFLLENGEFPKEKVDHIDGVGHNNKRTNLRKATQQENCFNTKPHKDSKTGVKGVSWSDAKQRFIVKIQANRKELYVGCFDNIEEAGEAAKQARIKHHGEYAWDLKDNREHTATAFPTDRRTL